MLRNWRTFVLLALLIWPVALYAVFGSLWLYQHGWSWVLGIGLAWIFSYGAMAYLADHWTRSRNPLLPPLDWEAPRTFTPRDRDAWAIVERMAKRADEAPLEAFSNADIYINTGRELAATLAKHYHPSSREPIDNVPVVEILTALELAAEDLNRLCREVPGGDILTPGHWKQAVSAANFMNKANEVYTYLLPLFSPVAGLARLGTQKLIAQPAWRNMQRSLMRWFFRAYVNRLGHHLVELYSGRLAIGADHYRRLTRRTADRVAGAHEGGPVPVAVVAGAERSGKSLLIAALEKVIGDGDLTGVRATLLEAGREPALADRLTPLTFVEVPGYKAIPGTDTARERASRKDAVAAAVEADLLVLIADAGRGDLSDDVHFAREWFDWFKERPALERPPTLVLVTGFDRAAAASEAAAGNGGAAAVGTQSRPTREQAIQALKAELPEGLNRVVAVEIEGQSPAAVAEAVLPALARRMPEAERVALLRHLHKQSTRSKARRVIDTLGKQGKRLWGEVQSRAPWRKDEED